jgi:hypothetical protein
MQNLLRKCATMGMEEEAVWILDRMYECDAVRPTFECLGLVAQALCVSGNYSESWGMLQVSAVLCPILLGRCLLS